MLTLLCVIVALWYLEDVLRFESMPQLEPDEQAILAGPLISVLIPARDEAARIGGCLDGLASQQYRHFETIVVDDHSSDGTAALVRSYSERVPHLAILPGAELPEGWAGKCWACQQATGRARGEWLLFLDADVLPEPALLATLAAHIRSAKVDLLSLLPLIQLGSFAERAVLPAFFQLLAQIYPFKLVNNPASPLAFAIGQCILVRRSVYEAVGGHAAVRASILEDMELARRVKQAGYRLEALAAPKLIAVRMYTGWQTLRDGLGKNAATGYRNGGLRAAWAGLRQGIMALLPLDLLAVGAALSVFQPQSLEGGIVALHGLLLLLVALVCRGWLAYRRFRVGALWGALFPIGTLLYFWVAIRAVVQLRGKGVVWKGRIFTR